MTKVWYWSVEHLRDVLFLLPLFAPLHFLAVASSINFTIDAAHSMTLHLSSGKLVENSTAPNRKDRIICERVHVKGVPRLLNLKKYADTMKVKVKVLKIASDVHLPKVHLCFHRNVSIGIGMCHKDNWEKLSKDSWIGSMSPYDCRLLDTCMPPPFFAIEASIEEETRLFHLVFMLLGAFLLILAPGMSKSVIFYYSNAMIWGVILVAFIILFQGMTLLPTGRKTSLMIFVYGSTVGLGTVLLRYLSGLLHSALSGLGVNADIYNPVALLLLLCLVLAGAWFGFWAVRKFILSKDGSVDTSTATFVRWSIRIVGGVLITQSSLDHLLATGAWYLQQFSCMQLGVVGLGSFIICSGTWLKQLNPSLGFVLPDSTFMRKSSIDSLHEVSAKENRVSKSGNRASKWIPCSSAYGHRSAMHVETNGETESQTYYSTFHATPENKTFSKEEWDAFTKNSTRRALRELISSPEFVEWAISNADRITLTPTDNDRRHVSDNTGTRRQWFGWS